MKHGQFLKKLVSVLAVIALFLVMVPVGLADNGEADTDAAVTDAPAQDGQSETEGTASKVDTYLSYYNVHADAARPGDVITLGVEQVTGSQKTEAALVAAPEREGETAVFLGNANLWTEWQFEVTTPGVYNMMVEYYPVKETSTGRDITLEVAVDGKTPFVEAATLTLPRLWKDDPEGLINNGTEFKKDQTNNDLRPGQIEIIEWQRNSFLDPLGMYQEPYFFYLEAGVHTVRFNSVREEMIVRTIELSAPAALPTYEEYASQFDSAKTTSGEVITLEAEIPFSKTSSTLYALSDHQDSGTTPNHPVNMLLNTIGGANWTSNGQEITWMVPQTVQEGWYTLAFRARQQENQGMISYRALKINGEIPFKEAYNLEFPYDTDWEVRTVGTTENPLKLYVKPGDTITLAATAGALCDVLRTIQQTVLDLNQIYREIIVITGTAPDIYQDYYLEDEIPGLKERFLEQQAILKEIADKIIAVTGETGSQTSTILKAADKIGIYATKSYEITANLSEFKSNIESLSSLLLTFGGQPLELDCLYFIPDGAKVPTGRATFFGSLSFEVRKFFGSFFNDYQDGTGGDETIVVWVTTGRDQLQVVNSLITNFTAETGIPVRLALVDTGDTLIQATMAGKGPDVALMVAASYAINLSMRGALVDLSKAPYNIKDTMAAKGTTIDESAWRQYIYRKGMTVADEGIYGIPETQTWPMLFYRTDILEELDLTPPDTWEDFYEMLRTLQGRNMNFGMTETSSALPGVSGSIDVFQSLLFQRGSNYYNDTLTKTLFDTPEAYDAFEQWAQFYSKYGVARSVDFYNRLRTGDVPIGISTYATYNQLMAAAPELRGLWKMAVTPGTVQKDGTIDRSVAAPSNGCMMLQAAEKRGVAENAYKFLTWWASAATQTEYGQQLEATMGVAARYAPASLEAFEQMGWTIEEKEVLLAQRQYINHVYSIPGDYMVSRSLTNAVRSALDGDTEPRRALSQYNRDINAEITRKRKEFGLPAAEN